MTQSEKLAFVTASINKSVSSDIVLHYYLTY